MKIALFVEGSEAPPMSRHGRNALETMWCEHLAALANCRAFDVVHPISKANIEQLDPNAPRVSGNQEALDQLLARVLRSRSGIEAAIVAWDLEPPLRPEPPLPSERCRWLETKWIMNKLATSRELPASWRKVALQRSKDYDQRQKPSARRKSRSLHRYEIRLLCMVPEFESLFLDERGMRQVLGVGGRRVRGWPRDWNPSPTKRGKEILHQAIQAARCLSLRGFPPVRGTINRTATDEWEEWLLREFRNNDEAATFLDGHAIVARLQEIGLPRSR